MARWQALDKMQALFAAIIVVPTMLIAVLGLVFADMGVQEETSDPVASTPAQPVTTSVPTSDVSVSTTIPPPPPQAATPPAAATPFAQGVYGVHPHAARQAAEWRDTRPADAALMERMAETPTATWFGDWIPDVRSAAGDLVGAAAATGRRPVLVAYNIPEHDCEGRAGGGAANENAYRTWIGELAAGIGDRPAAVILEPHALGHLCGDVSAKYRMLGDAVEVLEAGAGTDVYLDAGHPNRLDVATAAERLRAAGVEKARGFSLNVANFVTTGETEQYGEEIVAALGGKGQYVIDTSRNGNGEGNGEGGEDGAGWCNPPGRALGAAPTADTAGAHADAYLWIKVPGESDGVCGGAPAAGTWMPEYALGLAREA